MKKKKTTRGSLRGRVKRIHDYGPSSSICSGCGKRYDAEDAHLHAHHKKLHRKIRAGGPVSGTELMIKASAVTSALRALVDAYERLSVAICRADKHGMKPLNSDYATGVRIL